MRQPHAEDIYLAYDKFITEFLFSKKSILSNHENILTTEALNNCFINYHDNFIEGARSFDDKITQQFKEADINTKLVFAHAEWLWSFSVDGVDYSNIDLDKLETEEIKFLDRIEEIINQKKLVYA